MFYSWLMQTAFGFAANDIAHWRASLAPLLATVAPLPVRRPVAQLVKSIISSRTRDAVSQAAFDRLRGAFPTAGRLAAAGLGAVEQAIADVTFAADKAAYVVGALNRLRGGPYGFALEGMAARPLAESLAYLETLPGVARKVSAATVNASTLALPVLIVDTHVLRVLSRLGAVDATANYRLASESVTTAMPGWSGADFLAFHMGVKRLGQVTCHVDAPDCRGCLLRDTCATGRRRG